MPRRELLTLAQRDELLAFPTEEADLLRHYTFSTHDLAVIRRHRGDHNRLGFAVQFCYLRFPGRLIALDEVPYPPILGMAAAQLKVPTGAWPFYAERHETRREHLLELQEHFGFQTFTVAHHRQFAAALASLADQTHQGILLAQALVQSLRNAKIILPGLPVVERLCAEVVARAQQRLYKRLTAPLTEGQKQKLETLLNVREGTRQTFLAWLRQSAGAPSARNLLDHLAKLQALRQVGLPLEIGRTVHQNHLLRLAREGAQTTVYHLKDFEIQRRQATLVAILLDTQATLIDEILDLHDRMVGSAFAKAKRAYEASFQQSGKDINEKVRLYAQVGQALIEAKKAGTDPFAAIEQIVSWECFTQSVSEAETLARSEDFDYLGLLGNHYSQFRRYTPTFLEAFEFKAAPAAQKILDAIEVLKGLAVANSRSLPADAPNDFIRRRWAPYVFTEAGLDRRYYELCALTELKNALRSGDIWVPGSRRFRDFEDYLLPTTAFEVLNVSEELPFVAGGGFDRYWTEREALLRRELEKVDALATQNALPDAEITEGVLKVAPLTNAVPQEAEALMRQAYALLPHVKVTDLLLEVDRWTGFTADFTHLKHHEPAPDRPLLLTVILADAINLGLRKMAEACPGTSMAKLSWLSAWHIRDETYSKALARLVNHQHCQPFAAHWGEGTTSSSDGQQFRAGGRGEQAGQVNLRYGTEPGVLFYTHVSDQYAPFHTKVINATVRDATHVLDGLLYHESDLKIEEHYTDTAGFTDHVFALCHLLGFRFAPRIRDLADRRLYMPNKETTYPALGHLVGGTLNVRQMAPQWSEILRLATSIKRGTVTASLILRKLGAYPRQNSLALALRELGRVERTLFTLDWLQNPELRRRVQVGLNKGEAKNALARAVFFNRLGELRDRTFENQRYRASGLNLAVAAIVLWNTVYLERPSKGSARRVSGSTMHF
jgi:TnpA family transposase